jgi:hypothetical protein
LTKRRFGSILGRMSTITPKDDTQIYDKDRGTGQRTPLARRSLLVGGATLLVAAAGARLVGAAAKPAITVHKSPT